MEALYLPVLQGKCAMLDDWHGMWLSPDGEFIRVRGHGQWAIRSEDKARFLEEAQTLADNHASGRLEDYKLMSNL